MLNDKTKCTKDELLDRIEDDYYHADLDLEGEDLSNIDLSELHFKDCSFKNCNLSNADLELSDFIGCDLSGANLSGIVASGAKFEDCVGANTLRSRDPWVFCDQSDIWDCSDALWKEFKEYVRTDYHPADDDHSLPPEEYELWEDFKNERIADGENGKLYQRYLDICSPLLY